MARNYRLVKRDGYFAIHEVMHDANGEVTHWTELPVNFLSGTAKDVRANLKQALKDACEKPVLIEKREEQRLASTLDPPPSRR